MMLLSFSSTETCGAPAVDPPDVPMWSSAMRVTELTGSNRTAGLFSMAGIRALEDTDTK